MLPHADLLLHPVWRDFFSLQIHHFLKNSLSKCYKQQVYLKPVFFNHFFPEKGR